jgi:predicted transcriptional regulator
MVPTARPVAVMLEPDIHARMKRLAFCQNSIRAWNEYQPTGLHVTMEEVDAWLAKLEGGQDVEPPECHA